MLHCKHQHYDIAADLLAEHSDLTYKLLTPDTYSFLEASVMVCVSLPLLSPAITITISPPLQYFHHSPSPSPSLPPTFTINHFLPTLVIVGGGGFEEIWVVLRRINSNAEKVIDTFPPLFDVQISLLSLLPGGNFPGRSVPQVR